MRSGLDPTDYLIAVAKKKPRLQALLDRLDQLTQESIDALSEPLWVRQALSKLKGSNGESQSMRVQSIVNQVIAAEEAAAAAPKRTYEVRIWDCAPSFIGTASFGDASSWQIEINTGDSIMIIDENNIKVGDSHIKISEEMLTPLMLQSKFVGYMTLDNFKGFHRALLNQKHKII